MAVRLNICSKSVRNTTFLQNISAVLLDFRPQSDPTWRSIAQQRDVSDFQFLDKKNLCLWSPLSPQVVGRYRDWLRSGMSWDRIPVGTRFSAPVQTGPEAHPASCTMGTGSFTGVKSGRGMRLTPYPFLVPWSWKGRAIPLLPLWAVRPIQSLSPCTRVPFTFTFTYHLTKFRHGVFPHPVYEGK